MGVLIGTYTVATGVVITAPASATLIGAPLALELGGGNRPRAVTWRIKTTATSTPIGAFVVLPVHYLVSGDVFTAGYLIGAGDSAPTLTGALSNNVNGVVSYRQLWGGSGSSLSADLNTNLVALYYQGGTSGTITVTVDAYLWA